MRTRWIAVIGLGPWLLWTNAQAAPESHCDRSCMTAVATSRLFDDCERHENGGHSTNNKTPVPWPVALGSPEDNRAMAILGTLTCKAQIDSQVLSFITPLWPRRLAVVDEQKGLVFSVPMFNHRGGVRTIKIQ